jgi:hypothetical protein
VEKREFGAIVAAADESREDAAESTERRVQRGTGTSPAARGRYDHSPVGGADELATEEERDDEPRQLEVQTVAQRYDLARRIVPIFYILALALPIRAAVPIAEALGGQDTNVTVTVSLSVVISVALSGAYLALWRKNRQQAAELRRLRRRARDLELELDRRKELNP